MEALPVAARYGPNGEFASGGASRLTEYVAGAARLSDATVGVEFPLAVTSRAPPVVFIAPTDDAISLRAPPAIVSVDEVLIWRFVSSIAPPVTVRGVVVTGGAQLT